MKKTTERTDSGDSSEVSSMSKLDDEEAGQGESNVYGAQRERSINTDHH
jgi:hypothetical protein